MAVAVLSIPSVAVAITIGEPLNGNCIPFGCDLTGAATRYQQVYSAGEFTGSLAIGKIQFQMTLLPGGQLASGTFQLRLSTTSVAVGNLDLNLDNNLGADDQLFTIATLEGGTAPSVLSFSGAPFAYDPANGNLLLDIQISSFSHPCSNSSLPECSFYDSDTGGPFSRATDFGSRLEADNAGLVTTFLLPEPSTALLLMAGLLLATHRSRA